MIINGVTELFHLPRCYRRLGCGRYYLDWSWCGWRYWSGWRLGEDWLTWINFTTLKGFNTRPATTLCISGTISVHRNAFIWKCGHINPISQAVVARIFTLLTI